MTLAGQLLLDRAQLDVVDAVERIGGLQAQEPASPYLTLWTRLQAVSADDISRAIHHRDLVKATLHRGTLHLVSAADYRASISALITVTRTKWMNEVRGLPVVRPLPALRRLHPRSRRRAMGLRAPAGAGGCARGWKRHPSTSQRVSSKSCAPICAPSRRPAPPTSHSGWA